MEVFLKVLQAIRISAKAENYWCNIFKLAVAIHAMASLLLRFPVPGMPSSLLSAF